jgi:hypothetical protein
MMGPIDDNVCAAFGTAVPSMMPALGHMRCNLSTDMDRGNF